MILNEIQARMPIWYQAQKCINLTSAPGLGKTTVVVEGVPRLAERFNKNLGLVLINGGTLTPPDSIGYLMPKQEKGKPASSFFTEPFWFITTEGKHITEYDGGVILIDEADKMDVEVKKVVGEAALSRRLGPHKLPPGWVVWMTGNTQKHRSGSTKELDHLINRRIEITVTPDLDSLLDWMSKHNTSHVTTTFTKQNPVVVLQSDVPEKQGPWCTPRSLCEFDDYLRVATEFNNNVVPNDPIIKEEAEGSIGVAAAAQYFSFIKMELEAPSLQEILANPSGTAVPMRPDMQMLMCYKMAFAITKDNCGPIIEYMDRFGKEFAVTFAVSACQRQSKLALAPPFHRWAASNASLLAAISSKNV